jgi:hypothetical protein
MKMEEEEVEKVKKKDNDRNMKDDSLRMERKER